MRVLGNARRRAERANARAAPAGRITVASACRANVLVKTYDAAGAAAPAPFHLLVSC